MLISNKKRNCTLTVPLFYHLVVLGRIMNLPVLLCIASYNMQSHILKFYLLRSPGVLHHISFPLSAEVPVHKPDQDSEQYPIIKVLLACFSHKRIPDTNGLFQVTFKNFTYSYYCPEVLNIQKSVLFYPHNNSCHSRSAQNFPLPPEGVFLLSSYHCQSFPIFITDYMFP